MKPNKSIKHLKLLLLSLLLATGSAGVAQNPFVSTYESEDKVLGTISKYHLKPQKINDEYSSVVFRLFINYLDPYHTIFNQSEITKLREFEYKIDDEVALKPEARKLLGVVAPMYKQALERTVKKLDSLKAIKPDYYKEEFWEYYIDTGTNYSISQDVKLMQLVKLMVYGKVTGRMQDDSTLTFKTALADEQEMRKQVISQYIKRYNKILNAENGVNNKVSNFFLKALSTANDPHTIYLSNTELKSFEDALSKENGRFGFTLDEDENGDLIIAYIKPGSPTWRSNKLHKGDKLVRFKINKTQVVDLTNATYDEAHEALDANKYPQMEITVKNAEGNVVSVTLVKEKVANEDNIIRGYVMQQDSIKVGYISLPGFYTDYDMPGVKGCANDVATVIMRLKKEGIEALVMDLRDNGGGSVTEAVELAGIFIDEGPFFLYRTYEGKTTTIKDLNRGTVYDGPLTVMVNNQSASASEMFVGILQDYNRAIIAGTPSYGKSVAQIVLPADTTLFYSTKRTGLTSLTANGYVKVTDSKIYRLNGSTIQETGVRPDIALPAEVSGFDEVEKNSVNHLLNDTVMKKVTYSPLQPLPVSTLASLSSQRVKQSAAFSRIEAYNTWVNKFFSYKGKPAINLNATHYQEILDKQRSNDKQIETEISGKPNKLTLKNTELDIIYFKVDTDAAKADEEVKKELQKDPQLLECFHIMADYLSIKNKP